MALPAPENTVRADEIGGQNEAIVAEFEKQRVNLQGEKDALDRRDQRLSRARGLSFLGALCSVGYAAFSQPSAGSSAPPPMGWWYAAIALSLVFTVFVVLHARLSTALFALERRLRWRELAILRCRGEYRAGPKEAAARGDAFVDAAHAYSGDLDIFGPASLFEQLNTTQTPQGASILAGWLSSPATPQTVTARQSAVKELASQGQLREDMALAGMRAKNINRDARSFVAWAAETSDPQPATWTLSLAAVLLTGTWIALLVVPLAGASWGNWWLLGAVAQLGLMALVRGNTEAILGTVCVRQSPLKTYQDLLALLEEKPFEDACLQTLQKKLSSQGRSASAAIRHLERLTGMASVRLNGMMLIIANGLLSWDIWSAWRVARWRARHGRDVARWLESLAEFEALASLATFSHEHPTYCWPEVGDEQTHFKATALGHPLIPHAQRVTNDVALENPMPALLITGSNMSGKSTMLRSMGVNSVLALAGAPVCATSLRISPLRLFTSMRIGDALDRGASRFFAEVEKLKAVIDAVAEQGKPPIMFLLDEVLHGTNSRERNIGAKAVVAHLLEAGAIGCVSSHDLGLVELERLTDGKLRNVHFEDYVRKGKMLFDYKMKEGPVSTSNALRLMRMVGIDLAFETELAPVDAAPQAADSPRAATSGS